MSRLSSLALSNLANGIETGQPWPRYRTKKAAPFTVDVEVGRVDRDADDWESTTCYVTEDDLQAALSDAQTELEAEDAGLMRSVALSVAGVV